MPEKKVYFATNRNVLPNDALGTEIAHLVGSFRVGHSVAERRDGDWEVRPGSFFLAPETEQQPRGSDILFPELMNDLRLLKADSEKIALVYIHGAACTFDKAISLAAKAAGLYETAQTEIVPFTFSYPTNGRYNPLDYLDDRNDAAFSGVAMARAFARFVDFLLRSPNRCFRKVFLVCHSLGNYAFRVGLQALANSQTMRTIQLFDGIFLMAADEDSDALMLDSKLRPIDLLTREVHVYFRPDDKLLRLSDVIHVDRLGQTGPQPPIIQQTVRLQINVIDVRFVSEVEDFERHRYYVSSPEVVADIRQVIHQAPGSDIPGRTPVGPDRPGYFVLNR